MFKNKRCSLFFLRESTGGAAWPCAQSLLCEEVLLGLGEGFEEEEEKKQVCVQGDLQPKKGNASKSPPSTHAANVVAPRLFKHIACARKYAHTHVAAALGGDQAACATRVLVPPPPKCARATPRRRWRNSHKKTLTDKEEEKRVEVPARGKPQINEFESGGGKGGIIQRRGRARCSRAHALALLGADDGSALGVVVGVVDPLLILFVGANQTEKKTWEELGWECGAKKEGRANASRPAGRPPLRTHTHTLLYTSKRPARHQKGAPPRPSATARPPSRRRRR